MKMDSSKISQVTKISAVVLGLTAAGSAIAWGGHGGNEDGHQKRGTQNENHHKGMGYGGCGLRGGIDHQEMVNRELSADDIQTLAEARLIMLGNDNLKVGPVKTTEDGYSVSIVTEKSGDLVRTLELAKNGMPMRMMERLEEHEKSRKN